jgi:hypothetical protein
LRSGHADVAAIGLEQVDQHLADGMVAGRNQGLGLGDGPDRVIG